MARTSRKHMERAPNQPLSPVYHAGAYCRLSVQDERHMDRHTLETQCQIVVNYMKQQPDICSFQVYTDNGETGSQFERPGFTRMMQDIRAGSINCVVVKDLSRFGRNFKEVGRYLEDIFPLLGVRFLSIAEGYDSLHASSPSHELTLPWTNLMNQLYAQDISTKVCSSLASLREQGAFLGSRAPYGYLKDPEDRHRLILDQPAAAVVRSLYQWILEGWSNGSIVKHLNALQIPTPSRHFYEMGLLHAQQFRDSRDWRASLISKLVRNPVYMGAMAQGKRRNSYFQTWANGPVPPEQWVVVKNTHEPVVPAATFYAAQEILCHRSTQRAAPAVQHQQLRSGAPYG